MPSLAQRVDPGKAEGIRPALCSKLEGVTGSMAMSKVLKALRAGWRNIRVGGPLPIISVALRLGPFTLLKSSETPRKFYVGYIYMCRIRNYN